jgi:hypothetical protein
VFLRYLRIGLARGTREVNLWTHSDACCSSRARLAVKREAMRGAVAAVFLLGLGMQAADT